MAKRLIINKGDKFGMLSIVSEIEKKGKHRNFHCLCECGLYKNVLLTNLTTGKTTSCGCNQHKSIGLSNSTHKMTGRKEYIAWQNMKSRCYNENNSRFSHYGERGITVCKRWLDSFENFFSDMGECEKGMSIERIDVNGNYEPSNCIWANAKQQANNKTNNFLVELDGKIMTLANACEIKNISYKTVHKRIKDGWDIEKALKTPLMKNQHSFQPTPEVA